MSLKQTKGIQTLQLHLDSFFLPPSGLGASESGPA